MPALHDTGLIEEYKEKGKTGTFSTVAICHTNALLILETLFSYFYMCRNLIFTKYIGLLHTQLPLIKLSHVFVNLNL